jgi:hypothetical protein
MAQPREGLSVPYTLSQRKRGSTKKGWRLAERHPSEPTAQRFSSARVNGLFDTQRVIGFPDKKHISTSYVERQNLTMRMHMRRFTRLTNGFSKKIENHAHHVALHFMYYNFCRVHQTLRVTPAMEAKVALPDGKEESVTDHIWTVDEIVALIPEEEIAILK